MRPEPTKFCAQKYQGFSLISLVSHKIDNIITITTSHIRPTQLLILHNELGINISLVRVDEFTSFFHSIHSIFKTPWGTVIQSIDSKIMNNSMPISMSFLRV